MSTFEERLTALEADVQAIKYNHAAQIRSVAEYLNLVHQDVVALREETRDAFRTVDAHLSGHDAEFSDIKRSLLTILDRLPPAPEQ